MMQPGDGPVSAAKVAIIGAIVFTTAGSLAVRLLANARIDSTDLGRNPLRSLAELTDVGLEANIATWLSVVLLALLAFLLAIRAAISPERSGWIVLAFASLALSVDEASELHERIAGVAGERIRIPAVDLAFPWVVPGAIVALALLFITHRSTRTMSPRLRKQFARAAAVFFAGALGVETIGGEIAAREGSRSVAYVLTYHVEEALEFTGIALAIFTVINSISLRSSNTSIELKPRGARLDSAHGFSSESHS